MSTRAKKTALRKRRRWVRRMFPAGLDQDTITIDAGTDFFRVPVETMTGLYREIDRIQQAARGWQALADEQKARSPLRALRPRSEPSPEQQKEHDDKQHRSHTRRCPPVFVPAPRGEPADGREKQDDDEQPEHGRPPTQE